MYGPAGGGGGGPPDRGGRGPPKERRMTPKGQMSGNNMQPAITGLPPHMKAMFDARPPLEYFKPEKRTAGKPLAGIAQYVSLFETDAPPPRPKFVTNKERKVHIREARMKAQAEALEINAQSWNAHNNPKATEDPYKTLLVARLSYDTTEKKLRREFEQYGPIKTIRLVCDSENKPRGYAFIEYEREQDMKNAYKRADGRKIDGRRVVVDVERGRTVKGWRPRKFGGGLGGTRKSASDTVAVVKENGEGRGDGPRDDASRSSFEAKERRRSRSRERPAPREPARDEATAAYRPSRDDRGRERDRSRDRGAGADRDKRRRSRSRSRDRAKRERT